MKYVPNFEQFINESKYYIEVSVRDARKALDLLDDRYRRDYKTDGTNYYIFKDKELADDALQDLIDAGIEVEDENINESRGHSFYKIRSNKLNESEDHEVKMAQNQLDAIIKYTTELKDMIGEDEIDIPAWIQDHISQSYNYIKQASTNYHTLEESIDTRFRSEIFVNLKKAGFKPDDDFEFSGSQLYAKDIDVAKQIVDDLADKYRFVIQDKRIGKDGKVPVNVGRK